MSYDYANYHHFDRTHTQPLSRPVIPYRTAPPHRFHSGTTQHNHRTSTSHRPPPPHQMGCNNSNRTSWVVPTGGNAQDVLIGPSRRQSGTGRLDYMGHPRPPPRYDQQVDSQQTCDETIVDPFTQGFARVMARFDKLESKMDSSDRRVDKLEIPLLPDPDPPYDDYDPDAREYGAYRGSPRPSREPHRRQQQLGFHDGRPRRDDQGGGYQYRDAYRGAGRDPHNTIQGGRFAAPPQRQATCWDHPAMRQREWHDQRQPMCWDAPYQRGQFHQTGGETQRGVKMNAPHFDGSDATNWITDHCYSPPYIGPDMGPDSYVQPRNSYAQYRPWQPKYQPHSATKTEDPINAKLDRLSEALDRMETRVEATDRRMSRFRSSPQPDLDQPDVSPPLRKIEYPPSRNFIASFGPSRLSPNDSSDPPRHRTNSDQPPARQPSCWEPPLTATPAAGQLHQPYQLPPPLPRSYRQPQQPSPAPPSELLPYTAPGPSRPLHPLPVTAPFLASNRHLQVAVSLRQEEWQSKLHNDDEYGLINEVVPCLHDVVWEESIVEDKWKENGIGPEGFVGSKDGEDSDIFKMIKMIILRAFDPGICVSFSKRECEFLAMKMEKTDLHDSEKELPHEGVIKCVFATETFRIELHIPAKPVVYTPVRKFNGDDEGGCTTIWWAFDPGGDTAPMFLLSTLCIALWFPP